MTAEYVEFELFPVTARWWALVIRGLAAVAFGILAFVKPSISLLALVILWGAYALVDGVFATVLSIRGARIVRGWGWQLAGGIVSIGAGVVAFLWPGMTALVLLAVIAAWAVLTGTAEVVTAVRLRRHLRGEWMLAASGILSIVFGVTLAANPGAGALAVTWLIGLYALLFGALLVALGFRLRHWAGIPEHPAPAQRAPSHA
jgi:uncharacterized membrane protein HdeD (DUF308 family)